MAGGLPGGVNGSENSKELRSFWKITYLVLGLLAASGPCMVLLDGWSERKLQKAQFEEDLRQRQIQDRHDQSMSQLEVYLNGIPDSREATLRALIEIIDNESPADVLSNLAHRELDKIEAENESVAELAHANSQLARERQERARLQQELSSLDCDSLTEEEVERLSRQLAQQTEKVNNLSVERDHLIDELGKLTPVAQRAVDATKTMSVPMTEPEPSAHSGSGLGGRSNGGGGTCCVVCAGGQWCGVSVSTPCGSCFGGG